MENKTTQDVTISHFSTFQKFEDPDMEKCCSNCKNLIELYKHPTNDQYRGSVSETTGLFACIVHHNTLNNRMGMVFEQNMGQPLAQCELHEKHKS